jgi:DNA replicative helicase MCM subunit Mcm2 (Cdc46/Mcm family)
MLFITRKQIQKCQHDLDKEAKQKFFIEKWLELLKELSRKPDIYKSLALALSPSIY